jgi:hypothetical protein
MGIVTVIIVRVAVTIHVLRHDIGSRASGESGELSSQQVIWIATLATLAVTIGAIIAAKVSAAANSLDLGGA